MIYETHHLTIHVWLAAITKIDKSVPCFWFRTFPPIFQGTPLPKCKTTKGTMKEAERQVKVRLTEMLEGLG